jgi:hypothetical protein
VKSRPRSIMKVVTVVGFFVVAIVLMLTCRQWVFRVVNVIWKPYDKNFYSKNYQVEGGQIYILDSEAGERYPVKRFFSEGFEDASSVRDLIGLDRGWTSFTLQSPGAPGIGDYVKLRKRILGGESGFVENVVEPSRRRARSGLQCLRTLAVAPTSGMVCSKASLDTMLLHFTKGDDVWFSAWYYFERAGEFITLMDLETTFVRGWPGMRIRVNQGCLDMELKWPPKRVYRQSSEDRRLVPIGQWVHIQARLGLSELDDGIIQLWQDGDLLVDQRGKTLPFAEAVYNDLEIGLSAYNGGSDAVSLYVDDVVISAEPIGGLK